MFRAMYMQVELVVVRATGPENVPVDLVNTTLQTIVESALSTSTGENLRLNDRSAGS